jgi:hypothetical protein
MLADMPLEQKGPLLFPEYAKFENDSDYSGLRKNTLHKNTELAE